MSAEQKSDGTVHVCWDVGAAGPSPPDGFQLSWGSGSMARPWNY